MAKAPERVWLQWYGSGSPDDLGEVDVTSVTWAREEIFKHDVQYVRADVHEAAVREARREVWEKAIGVARGFVAANKRNIEDAATDFQISLFGYKLDTSRQIVKQLEAAAAKEGEK